MSKRKCFQRDFGIGQQQLAACSRLRTHHIDEGDLAGLRRQLDEDSEAAARLRVLRLPAVPRQLSIRTVRDFLVLQELPSQQQTLRQAAHSNRPQQPAVGFVHHPLQLLPQLSHLRQSQIRRRLPRRSDFPMQSLLHLVHVNRDTSRQRHRQQNDVRVARLSSDEAAGH